MELSNQTSLTRLMDTSHLKGGDVPFKQPVANQNTLNFPTGDDVAWPSWPTGWVPNESSARNTMTSAQAPAQQLPQVPTLMVMPETKQAAEPKSVGAPKSKKEKKAKSPSEGDTTQVPGLDPVKAGKMRRVDWRWAAQKGFLNKDTNEWNEEMGGMKAYLAQRNERMVTRKSKASEAQEVRKRKEALRAKAIRAASHLYVDYDRPTWSQAYQQDMNGMAMQQQAKAVYVQQQQQQQLQAPRVYQQQMDNMGAQVQQQQQQQAGLPLYLQSQLQQMPMNLTPQQSSGANHCISLQQQLINRGIGGGQQQQSGSAFQVCNNNNNNMNMVADQNQFLGGDMGMNSGYMQQQQPQQQQQQQPLQLQQQQQPQQQCSNGGLPAPVARSVSVPSMSNCGMGGNVGNNNFLGGGMSMSFDGLPMNEGYFNANGMSSQNQQQQMQSGCGGQQMGQQVQIQNQAQIQMLQQQLSTQRGWIN